MSGLGIGRGGAVDRPEAERTDMVMATLTSTEAKSEPLRGRVRYPKTDRCGNGSMVYLEVLVL